MKIVEMVDYQQSKRLTLSTMLTEHPGRATCLEVSKFRHRTFLVRTYKQVSQYSQGVPVSYVTQGAMGQDNCRRSYTLF